jgi:ATP-dependent exoDNAse (exonuclease V) alpha subunit
MAHDRLRASQRMGREKVRVSLAASQRAAVALALTNKLLVVTGRLGVGKATLINSILKILWPKAPAWRPRPSTVCSKPIRVMAGSNAARLIRSRPTCWSWMRSRWWTFL